MTSCFDLLLKLSVVFDVVNRCLLLRRLSWTGSQDNICIPVTSLAPHEFLPCLPDLLAYGTQASVLGRLLFFWNRNYLHLFLLWIALYRRNWNTISSCWLPNLYLQLALLQWTQPYYVFSFLDISVCGSYGNSNFKMSRTEIPTFHTICSPTATPLQ